MAALTLRQKKRVNHSQKKRRKHHPVQPYEPDDGGVHAGQTGQDGVAGGPDVADDPGTYGSGGEGTGGNPLGELGGEWTGGDLVDDGSEGEGTYGDSLE